MGMHKSGRNDTKTPGASVDMNKYQDKTLADYIARKQEDISFPKQTPPEKKKLTFEEWYLDSGWADVHASVCSGDDADSCKYLMERAWKAAQENV